MQAEATDIIFAVLAVPLVGFAAYVAARVAIKYGPELPRIWRETKK